MATTAFSPGPANEQGKPAKLLEALRTPDARFQGLPDFPYPPHYVESLSGYEGRRAQYLEEGPKDADHPSLGLDGEPTWSYLYRKMRPGLLESGARVVAPAFFGCGRPGNDEHAATPDSRLPQPAGYPRSRPLRAGVGRVGGSGGAVRLW